LEVFALMVGVDLALVAQSTTAWPQHESTVVSSFELSGAISGTARVFYPLPLANRMTCRMLQVEPPVAEMDILDAAGEIANMIVGNVRNCLENPWGSIDIGTPTVEIFRDCVLKNHSMSVSFCSCGDIVTVSMAFRNGTAPWDYLRSSLDRPGSDTLL